jgi:uncharacterized protein (TIGR03067 family)
VKCEMSDGDDEWSQREYLLELTNERFIFVSKSGKRTVYLMRLDAGASPPSFTWSQNNQVRFVGSYRLQQDQMTLVFKSGDRVENRPTNFEDRSGWRYVMRRIKRR